MTIDLQSEVISTEEMLAKIDGINEKWRLEGSKVTTETITAESLAAESLYQSLDVKQCSKLYGDVVRESELRVQRVDYKLAETNIALNSSLEEITREELQ